MMVIACAYSSVTAQQEIIDEIVAIVDDDIILRSDLLQYSLNLAFQMEIDPRVDTEKFEDLKQEVLDNMISQKIFLAKAEEDTIEANEREVDNVLDNQINRMIEQLGSVEKLEEYLGSPISKIKRDFRDDVRDNLKVEALKAQYMRKIQISRREVEGFYESMEDSLPELKETADISHILITNKPGEAADRRAKEKINEIKSRLDDGADFVELAKEFSEDPGSKERGGELGYFQRGEFIKEFEEVAFRLEPGEVSEIVKTEHGYHIIQGVDRQGEKINVRHILVRVAATKDDSMESESRVRNIRAMLDEPDADFAEIARKYTDDETSKESGGYLGLFAVEELQEEEFIKVINSLEPGEISEPFQTRFGWHILKLNDKKGAREISIDTDWQQIEKWALSIKQQKEIGEWLEELKKETFIDIKK
jgi:peptidyl-prolyl cis-trans isomerase SurA